MSGRPQGSMKGRVTAAVATALLLAGLSFTPPVFAQSPSPNANFVNVSPGSTGIPSGASGIVVEGLGSGSCSYSLSSIETTTVYYINQGYLTWTELSPQSACASISSYQSYVTSIISYVQANAANWGTYWDGIMLDEESGFGYSTTSLQTLNNAVDVDMSGTGGIAWWSTEDFSGTNNWSQSAYNGLVNGSFPAPQISTAYMVTLANSYLSSYGGTTLVTWSTSYPSPYTNEAASTNAINGGPYVQSGLYWANEFV